MFLFLKSKIKRMVKMFLFKIPHFRTPEHMNHKLFNVKKTFPIFRIITLLNHKNDRIKII